MDYLAQIQLMVRAGPGLEITRFQVQRPNHSATLPPAIKRIAAEYGKIGTSLKDLKIAVIALPPVVKRIAAEYGKIGSSLKDPKIAVIVLLGFSMFFLHLMN